ncbi:CDGSH iron-sulfur domain-containing protein [Pleurocapsa sp. FMAR1]|nr:CDGSH iron-sulfur domain-containing protein [Pleurocapsa sp. FMAR1]
MNNQFVKVRLEAKTHYICACGRRNKPFCDGSHVKTNIQPLVLEL